LRLRGRDTQTLEVKVYLDSKALTDADIAHIGSELWKVHNLLGHAMQELAADRPEDESPSEASQCVATAFLRVHELGFGLGYPSDRIAA
jgi:hypothetical protein